LTTVRDKIRIHGEKGSIGVEALFNTGAKSSYIDEAIAEKIGYRRYPKPRKIPLAVKEAEANLIGYSPVDLEIAGCLMPETEVLGVIEDLREEAIIGMNLIEKYDIILDVKEGKVKLKKSPPEVILI